jgi:hypothetical protein
MLALFAVILHFRLENADLMMRIDADCRARGAPGMSLQQVGFYVRDRIHASLYLEHLHDEYQRRIGEALVIA